MDVKNQQKFNKQVSEMNPEHKTAQYKLGMWMAEERFK
jgi:hypothetical protein